MSDFFAQQERDELVLRLKGLVHVRALLETRGASAAELEAHTAEIERVRDELERFAKLSVERAAA